MNALVGDGSKNKTMDETTGSGMDRHVFAKKMIKAIEARKEEVYIGGAKEVMAIRMKRFFPGFFSRIVRNAKVR